MEVTSDFFREECMYSQMKVGSQQPVTLNFNELMIQRKDRNKGNWGQKGKMSNRLA